MRAAFYAELIFQYEYAPARIGVEVLVPRRVAGVSTRFDSALNPRHSWFFVNRVRQQQNGSAEKQCVEEKVQRHHVCGRGQEQRLVDP